MKPFSSRHFLEILLAAFLIPFSAAQAADTSHAPIGHPKTPYSSRLQHLGLLRFSRYTSM